jgi:hypothetical protein
MKELLSAEKNFLFLLHTQCGKEKEEGNKARKKKRKK